MALTDDQREMLAADLPADAVRTRSQGGSTISYVDGWWVVSRLNEVFGPVGWTFTVGDPVLRDVDGKVCVYVRGTLAAEGAVRSDLGAAVTASRTITADALETAIKAAATDALKRCARTFGPSFGLALYDKDQRTVGHSTACVEILGSLASATDLAAWQRDHRAAVNKLPPEERKAVSDAFDARKATANDNAGPQPTTSPDDAEAALSRAMEGIENAQGVVEVWRAHRVALAKLPKPAREAAWGRLVKVAGTFLPAGTDAKAWLKHEVEAADEAAKRAGGDR